jgi:uncharacterized membrane protein YkgB
MTPVGFLKMSAAGLAGSVLGFFSVIAFQLRYFTHQGNDLDWTYALGGFFVLSGCGSLILMIIAIVLVARDKSEGNDSSDLKLTGRD